MRGASWLIGVAIAVTSSFMSRGALPFPVRDGAAGAAEAGAYLGSSACQSCHQSEYTSWRRTLHVQMTKPIADAVVVGDFSPGTHLEQNGRAYTMETHDGRYFVSVAH